MRQVVDEIVFYLTEGQYNLRLKVVEHNKPTRSTISYAKGKRTQLNSVPIQKLALRKKYGNQYAADWIFFLYPMDKQANRQIGDEAGRLDDLDELGCGRIYIVK